MSQTVPKDRDSLIGRTIDGKYRVLERIGRGGMGAVYKAEHIMMERTVALKVIHSNLVDPDDDEFLKRFHREAKTTSKIKHPNAVTIHDFGVDGEIPYLVMEYVTGISLRELLSQEGPLSHERIIKILGHIAAALDEAHSQGIIHRDLKPENIIITKYRDGSEWAVVLDFGIAKVIGQVTSDQTLKTHTGRIIGTPQYMSPEQITGKALDARSDLYSLAIIAYQMFTGEVPFRADSIGELMVQHLTILPQSMCEFKPALTIPQPFDTIVLRALAKAPADRQQSTLEFSKEMQQASAGAGSTAFSKEAGVETGAATMLAASSHGVKEDSQPKETPSRKRGLAISLIGLLVCVLCICYFALQRLAQNASEAFNQVAQKIDAPATNETTANSDAVTSQETGIAAPTAHDISPQEVVDAGRKLFEAKNYLEARPLLEKAASLDQPLAKFLLGRIYLEGLGIPKDEAEAFKWIKQAADQGDSSGQHYLGQMYQNGLGVTQDSGEAVKWLRKSAEQGNSGGQVGLAWTYIFGAGVTQDGAEAVKWLRKSADQGDSSGENWLGHIYRHGLAVTRDASEAVKWFRKSAEHGDSQGQSGLGEMYANGYGVTKDYSEAIKWFRKSAEQGDVAGQYNLGEMYAKDHEATQDYAESVIWYRKAAEQGFGPAKNKLGLLYWQGLGVTKDDVEAAKLFEEAAWQGDEEAKANLDKIRRAVAEKTSEEPESVNSLVQQLHSKSRSERSAAADKLVSIGEPAIDPVMLAAKDKNSGVRYWAIQILGRLKAEKAVETLVSALNDPSKDIQKQASDALRQIGSFSALTGIKEWEARKEVERMQLAEAERLRVAEAERIRIAEEERARLVAESARQAEAEQKRVEAEKIGTDELDLTPKITNIEHSFQDLLSRDEEKISGFDGSAAQTFRSGLSNIRAGNFVKASEIFSQFTRDNPGNSFTDNGYFWLGIAWAKIGRFDRSVGALAVVFQQYPAEDMVAPALFYLADSFIKLGAKDDAILTLEKLVDEKSDSVYAQKARTVLLKLRGSAVKRP